MIMSTKVLKMQVESCYYEMEEGSQYRFRFGAELKREKTTPEGNEDHRVRV